MNEPVLVILAAGMGSRYGGLKQLDPLGPNNEVILDYSLMDAKKAGFKKVVFIIKEAIKEDFMEVVYERASKLMEVKLAFQEIEKIPTEFKIPTDRSKPWGTTHALYCAIDEIDGPFMVINADDFYGAETFLKMYDYLLNSDRNKASMVGFPLANTLSENGTVSRGVCEVSETNHLTKITETMNVEAKNNVVGYTDENNEWHTFPQNTVVSMNCWGFSHDFLDILEDAFPHLLKELFEENPSKGELYLPMAVQTLLLDQNKKVDVLTTQDKWYGVTYPQDRPTVVKALKKYHDEGKY